MSNTKKILIVNNNLHVGGVQKALVSLLWNIRNQYDVTLLLFYGGGEYVEDLPPEVRVMTAGGGYRYLGMTRKDVSGLADKLGRTFFAAVSRVFGRKYAIALMGLGQKRLDGFDVAISYLHNSSEKMFYGGCNDFVLKHVDAGRKITFLHCDYLRSGGDTRENGVQYSKFDRIAACSQGCADAFLQAQPRLREKVRVVRNCHRYDQIRLEADASAVKFSDSAVSVVTVARLGKEKGVERAIRAIAQLGQEREKLHYYVIGDGIQRPLLEKIIEEQNLADTVTLCGMKKNPYGYIRAADLLLIPSYSEAAPLVIGEAAALGTPVLSTETSSAREMIEGTGCGWVCENSEEAMCHVLRELLSAPEEIRAVQKRLGKERPDNSVALRQFFECVEEDGGQLPE